MNQHLTPDQFAEFAFNADLHADDRDTAETLRRVDPIGAAHLAACSACREDMDRFLDSIRSFNSVSLGWAESRPIPRTPLPTSSRPAWTQPATWAPRSAWALAACVMIVSLFFSSMRLNRDDAAGLPPILQQDSEAAIASDNQLMTQIDHELRRPVRSPVSEYGLGLTTGSSPSQSRPQKARPESRVE